jgi:hypothetical protein
MAQQVDLHDLSDHRGYWLLLQPHDVQQPAALIQALKAASDPFASYITSRFSAEFQTLLAADGNTLSADRLVMLCNELNRLLRGDYLYEESRCAQVQITDPTHAREIQTMRAVKEERLIRLNRLLLEYAFPGMIAPINHQIRSLRPRIQAKVKQYQKRYRQVTSRFRMLPTFIIAGAQKSGTVALFIYLSQHPGVIRPFRKEPHFFDLHYQLGLNGYRNYFPAYWTQRFQAIRQQQPVMTFEATPDYIFHPLAAQRMAATLPDVKVIVILRNPIDRAWSHYVHNATTAGQREPLSFDDAIEGEDERLAGLENQIVSGETVNPPAYFHYSYRTRGIYIRQLRRLYDHIPADNILIVKNEDMASQTDAIYQQALAFVGLPEYHLPEYPRKNVSREAKYANRDIEIAPMSVATRQSLREFYQPYNQELYDFLGRDFGWD